MTRINIRNSSKSSAIVPARGGLGLVLGPSEEATVCPEGLRGQGRFWDMVYRGEIIEKRRATRAPRIILSHAGNSNEAA